MATPSYPPPGYLADQNRGPSFTAFDIVMICVTVFSIVLRFCSRSLIRPSDGITGRFWWDDFVALAAVPFVVASEIQALVLVRLGFGRHIWNYDPEKLPVSMRLLFATYFMYDTGLTLAKASALLFYQRIFPPRLAPKWFSIVLYVTHGLNICWFIGIIFGTVFMCDPVAKNWEPGLPGHCGTTGQLYLGSAIPSVVLDLIILIAPLPIIWGLNLNLTRKICLSLVFIAGYGVIVISIGRVVMTLTRAARINYDLTYEVIPIFYWLAAETPITMLCICLPAMSHLGRHIADGFTPLASKAMSIISSSYSGSLFGRSSKRSMDTDSGKMSEKTDTSLEMSRNGEHDDTFPANTTGYVARVSHAPEESREFGDGYDDEHDQDGFAGGIDGAQRMNSSATASNIRVQRDVTIARSEV